MVLSCRHGNDSVFVCFSHVNTNVNLGNNPCNLDQNYEPWPGLSLYINSVLLKLAKIASMVIICNHFIISCCHKHKYILRIITKYLRKVKKVKSVLNPIFIFMHAS